MAVKSLSVEPAMDAVFFDVKAEAEVVVFFELSDAVDVRDWDWDWDGAEPVVAMAERCERELIIKPRLKFENERHRRASKEDREQWGNPSISLTTKLVVRRK